MTATSAPPRTRPLKVALIGNPNTGKSTLFNALAGLNARVGNYPGVTVEKKIGRVRWRTHQIDLIDLPGTYSLSPRSPDEMVSVDVLLGRQADIGELDAIVCIADAANLERHLYLVSQILDIGRPVVLVLNMWDVARRQGWQIDVEKLQEKLGIPVVVTEAHRRRGIEELEEAIVSVIERPPPSRPRLFPAVFYEECDRLRQFLGNGIPFFLCERLLLDAGGTVEKRLSRQAEDGLPSHLAAARQRLREAGCPVPFVESECRFRWAREILSDVVIPPTEKRGRLTDRIDAVLTHRLLGLLIFAAMMFVVFQSIFTWAEPAMEACETAQNWVGTQIEGLVSPGPLRSLLVDGVVAGVGSVIVFLPQIALLFFFIALLEDCGYMARAAYMMDRLMATFGLSGKSFLPLMSSFACAVPGVMATRTIDNYRDRMVTILVAPLMSCSARLPVYLLLIAAFIPAVHYAGGFSLQGLVLFAMVSLGLVVAIPVAWLLKKTLFRGEPAPFLMELPEYKLPSPRLVLYRVYDRSKAFVQRAGTLIFATTLLVWAAGYFPEDHRKEGELTRQIEALDQAGEIADNSARRAQLQAEKNRENARLIEESFLGRAGRFVEPVVRPLGWDWRIGVGVIASFPAREVIIATLGTIYSLGGDVDEESQGLKGALQASRWPDGRPVFNVPVAISIMVFFALCAQCASTLVTIKRETNSWKWPVFCFCYMTGLAYVGALLTYQIGTALGGG